MKNPKKLKVLMISHVPIDSIYGTGSSLRLHLKALEQTGLYELSLICPKPILNGESTKMTDLEIKKTWPSIKNIKHAIIPYRFNYDGVGYNLDRKITTRAHMFVSFVVWRKLMKSIKLSPPDVIHLSSLVLASLALWFKRDPDFRSIPVLGHVRELLRNPLSQYDIRSIEALDMLIAIDSSARNRLLDVMNARVEIDRTTIVQNPFSISSARPDPSLFQDIDFRKTAVFGVAGLVSKDKGVKMVCEAFVKSNLSDAILLVVGKGEGGYGEEVKDFCLKNHAKLRWLGQQPNLLDRGFFNGIDAIVRGDETFRTGRTAYEALFSGKKAILPGDETDLDTDTDLGIFRKQVFLYKPMDENALAKAFESFKITISKKTPAKFGISKPRDNFDLYAQRIQECYDKAILRMLCFVSRG